MSCRGDCVLAVDIGTTSVRAMVFDPAGRVKARVQITYPTERPAPFHEEQDPDLLRRECYSAMRQCLAQPGAEPQRIGAIGFSSQAYSILALDAEDRPLTWSMPWSDGRAEEQAEAMKAAHGPQWLYEATGCPMNSIYPLAKLVWLRQQRPQIFMATRRFVSIKEYVTQPLVGEWAVDVSTASASGLLNLRTQRWQPEALAAAGVSAEQLSEPVSGLKSFALRGSALLAGCGLREDVQVFLGGADGPLANLGSGASAPGTVNIDLGTSGAARCIVPEPTTDAEASLWCFCLTDKLWASGGILTNVGNAYQWLVGNLQGVEEGGKTAAYERMNEQAAAISPGAEGLYFMPYMRKARSPYWDGRLRGTLYGMTAEHGCAHIARALFEAVGYDLRTIMGILRERVPLAAHVVLTGGLSQSPVVPQLLANVLGCELRLPANSEGSIAGAALMALHGLGEIRDFSFAHADLAYRSFEPAAAVHQRYNCLYKNYLRLVDTLRALTFVEDEQ